MLQSAYSSLSILMSTLLSPLIFGMQHPLIVVLAVAVQMVLGMLWYGPFFGKSWAKMHGITRDAKKAGLKSMAPALVVNVFGNLIQVLVLGRILTITRFSNLLAPMIAVALLWLAFNATETATGYAYMKKPVKLLAIEALYSLVAWELIALIIVLAY